MGWRVLPWNDGLGNKIVRNGHPRAGGDPVFFNGFWTPAFAGVTARGLFYDSIKKMNQKIKALPPWQNGEPMHKTGVRRQVDAL